MAWNRRIKFMDINPFPMSSWASEWVKEWMREQSKQSKQTSDQCKWAEEQMAKYSMRRFHMLSIHCAGEQGP